MNGLLTGLLARRETGLIEEIEKLERRIIQMENIAEAERWNMMDDNQFAQYDSDRKIIEEYEKGIRNRLSKEEILASLVNNALHRMKLINTPYHTNH
ncbi:hypothetical protein SGGMMB4_02677 [Sodalis glossinidius str. 'morsitans']|uniref:Uncharacterized protein n=1 Tax=Sodalis glossinidius (strain morsitans) TaxID=343509 RepID=A0A193QJ43_SODGM|nr:hypothetical protein [Sodalis glossinidius]CRL45133.1 hypothetical protein SGGMMB4_02677 [Sodalis glossinidius str. 'morsitans']